MWRVWMVTGASRGLGAHMSEAVLANGDRLVATARSRESIRLRGSTGRRQP
jgi:NAD(P)-dependent dehydrogenase (short-subunit alcohol dehydrogenase family)